MVRKNIESARGRAPRTIQVGERTPLSTTGIHVLREIGEAFDRDDPPTVYRNGLVKPGPDPTAEIEPGHNGGHYASESEGGSARPEPGEGTRPTGDDATRGAARSEVAEALLLRAPELSHAARRDLGATIDEYRDTRIRIVAPEVVWLLTRVHPIPDLPDRPWLLTAYPLRPHDWPLAWAWWGPGDWIGPRHTNYDGRGTICSFEQSHLTWRPGHPLLNLLDLHTGWIVRHMHLKYLDRWPGKQVYHTAYERLKEQRPGELCGGWECDSLVLYEHCCRPKDLQKSAFARELEFKSLIKNPLRRPLPAAVKIFDQLRRLPTLLES